MNPAVEHAVRVQLEDWRREARGSRQSETRYAARAEQHEAYARAEAEKLSRDAEADRDEDLLRAAEHRKDAERAEAAAAELEDALRAEGLEP